MNAANVMNTFVNAFFLSYAALFPIVNPVGSAPLFLGMTQFTTDKERHALACRIAINSFFLLLGSLLVGSHVLQIFGISLPVVRIGGGRRYGVRLSCLIRIRDLTKSMQRPAPFRLSRMCFTR